MTVHTVRLAAVAAGAAFMAATAAQAATPVSGAINSTSTAVYGATQVDDTKTLSWSGAPTTLGFTTEASSGDDAGTFVHTYETISATYGANAGAVQMSAGWDFVSSGGQGNQEAQIGGSPDWSYTFTAAGNGLFTLNYNVTGEGFTFGLDGWDIFWDGAGDGQTLFDVFDPTTSGVFTRSILAGQTYTVGLGTGGNVQTSDNNFNGVMYGNFRYEIAETGAAPEPASWALMLVGFGGLGALLRRRRMAVA